MKKIHYGWVVCAVGTLLIICNMGLCNNGFSVLLPYIEEKEGFSGTQGSSILSVRCVFSLISMLAVTKYYDILGSRKGAALATFFSACAYMIHSFGGSIYTYYCGAAVAGVGYGFGTMIPVSVFINNWFERRRGLALGICTMGTGICTICFPPIITKVIENVSLTAALRCESGFVLVCSLLILLLARKTPAEMGMKPYGADMVGKKIKAPVKTHGCRDLTAAEWVLFALALLFVGGVSTGGTGHFSIVIKSSGYSPETSSAVFSFLGIILILGKFLYGTVTDHIGCRLSTIIFYGIYVLGCLVTLSFAAGKTIFCYIFALCFGIGISPATVGMPIWAADLSKPESYARTVKWSQIFFVLGGVFFSSMPGMLYDRLGDYQSAYLVLGAFTVVNTIIITILYARFAKSKRLMETGGTE